MKIKELDKAIKKGEVVIGLEEVKKGLHEGVIKEVVVSSNGASFVDDLRLVAGDVPVSVISDSSRELGVRCKKPFSIAVLGLRKVK